MEDYSIKFIYMYSRSQLPKYRYLQTNRQSFYSQLEKTHYTTAIHRLNQQNQYLCQNVQSLLLENLQLKNKLYHQKQIHPYPKLDQKDDVCKQYSKYVTQKKENNYQQKRIDDRKNNEKKFQQQVRKNNHQEEAFQLKRETIIQDLYESNFRSKTDGTYSPKKGLYLSKEIKAQNRRLSQNEQSRFKASRKTENNRSNIYTEQIKEQENLYESRTNKIATNIEETPQKNPEMSEFKKMNHKKNNSPYVGLSPQKSQQTVTLRKSPSKKAQNPYSNQVYLQSARK